MVRCTCSSEQENCMPETNCRSSQENGSQVVQPYLLIHPASLICNSLNLIGILPNLFCNSFKNVFSYRSEHFYEFPLLRGRKKQHRNSKNLGISILFLLIICFCDIFIANKRQTAIKIPLFPAYKCSVVTRINNHQVPKMDPSVLNLDVLVHSWTMILDLLK